MSTLANKLLQHRQPNPSVDALPTAQGVCEETPIDANTDQ